MISVTTVTCARNIYGKFTSFYIDTGGFTAERATRASDNSDSQCPIKISTDAPLRESHPLERRNASRVPALGCSWENLFAGTTKHFRISSIGKRRYVSNFAFFLVTKFTNAASNYYCGYSIVKAFDKQSIFTLCKNFCAAIVIIYSQNTILNCYVCFVFGCTFVFLMRFSNFVVKCFNQRTFHLFWVSPRMVGRNHHQYQSRQNKCNATFHAKSPFGIKVPNKGSSDNPVDTGNSHSKREVDTVLSQGGWRQHKPHFSATLQSKYAIINSILWDQVDRSEA